VDEMDGAGLETRAHASLFVAADWMRPLR
jgi:hypothetical protein